MTPKDEEEFPDPNHPPSQDLFLYEPLPLSEQTTRVIWVENLKKESGPYLSIRLQTVDLDAVGPYDAISYTWDGQLPTVPILCSGKTLLVTENCFTILKSLRSIGHETPVWLDAISINQSSVQERNHQVSIMKDIYRKAAKVLIWPGKCDYTTQVLIDCLSKVCESKSMQAVFKELETCELILR